jgi:hypothetical protein
MIDNLQFIDRRNRYMNRAEARVKSYQNSNSQLNPMKDLSLGNSGISLFIEHAKCMSDETNLARRFGRKKRK